MDTGSNPVVVTPEETVLAPAPAPAPVQAEGKVKKYLVKCTSDREPIVYEEELDKVQEGGKKKKRKSTNKNAKRGGADPTGVITAGTLFLIQAAARRMLKKQKGGMAELTEAFKSDAIAQDGGKKKQRKQKQKGGMAELTEAFETILRVGQEGGKKKQRKQRGGQVIASSPAPVESMAPPPAPVAPVVETSQTQVGGKKKHRKQRGGEVIASSPAMIGGIVTPVPVAPVVSMPPQQGGKKKGSKQKGGEAIRSLPSPIETMTGGSMCGVQMGGSMCGIQEGGKKTRQNKQKGGMADLAEAFGTIARTGGENPGSFLPVSAAEDVLMKGGKKKQRKQKGGELGNFMKSIELKMGNMM